MLRASIIGKAAQRALQTLPCIIHVACGLGCAVDILHLEGLTFDKPREGSADAAKEEVAAEGSELVTKGSGGWRASHCHVGSMHPGSASVGIVGWEQGQEKMWRAMPGLQWQTSGDAGGTREKIEAKDTVVSVDRRTERAGGVRRPCC
ncbi:hypothetical protein B0H19DRAFT_1065275 [Mycena capillaripes]|nr:hypothetical protein B0H19DRAFT_1065275 [Mycena capillaripes]